MRSLSILFPLLLLLATTQLYGQSGMEPGQNDEAELSLITETPEEGFQLALRLARKGVTSTQPDKEVLFMLRDVYAQDPDALIAASQVVAIHFQTVAAANNYWRDPEK